MTEEWQEMTFKDKIVVVTGGAQGFCDEAWKAIYQYVFALAHGADKSLFYYGDWIKKPGVAIVSCNDGLRPVIMKLEATDEESKIDYAPVER